MDQDKQESLLKLNKSRLEIEDKIKSLQEKLTEYNIDFNSKLVDSEGFPIDSVDIYQVRLIKNQIVTLNYDHEEIMKKIEGLMFSN